MPPHRHFGPNDHAVRLADGRQLGYAEYGDPNGLPVVSNHGGLCSRLDIAPADETARRLHVRVIAPDRPGVGLSGRRAGRTLKDWPDDVAELADQLGLARFAVVGWSLGGEFAAVVARRFPQRVTRLGLVASTIPREWPEAAAGLNPIDAFLLRFSRRATVVDRITFRAMAEAASRSPERFGKRSGAPPGARLAVSRAMAEGLHDTRGALAEYEIYDRPWGFEPADIAVPTHLWQGTADDLVPESWAHLLTDAIPDAHLTVVEGATHFLWYDRWEEILSSLAAPVP
jgi:pimeloyl-ACP methyl ester carboxylesterase